MTTLYRDRRKIDPTRGALRGDNTPADPDRVEIGPTRLAYAEWAAAGLDLPDLQAMRHHRWERLTAAVVARDYAGLLLFDPLFDANLLQRSDCAVQRIGAASIRLLRWTLLMLLKLLLRRRLPPPPPRRQPA